ncbi:calcium-binding protein [Bacillus pseudomycoides]|uniref:calcium-binding protein n=1 Tax=Bacillus pseudomycoides TaxID=64104 RepID=UPI000BF79818|nr:calcium-binding protein [Bacillus pseudomycoides]PFW91659.1 calcium-binding protein [Bacillus pseudomycoides]PFX46365.1 calcium-binding protein [Bacillus pseudomycoides]
MLGSGTIVSGEAAHAEGRRTDTAMHAGVHIMGRFDNATDDYSWHLANGTDINNQSLAAKILNNGTGIADNGWVTGNADYAEMFETVDSQPDFGFV